MKTPIVNLTKIRQLRKENNIKQIEMAQYFGYKTQTAYSYLESGKMVMPAEQLMLIAHRFDVSMESLFLEQ